LAAEREEERCYESDDAAGDNPSPGIRGTGDHVCANDDRDSDEEDVTCGEGRELKAADPLEAA
jgi:hypothetical protein